MSKFLGPIHFWLHKKIQNQEALTQQLLNCRADKSTTEERVNLVAGTLAKGELEEIIDTGNIHGWLQGQLAIAERRFAAAVKELLRSGVAIGVLSDAALRFGRKNSLGKAADVRAAFRGINDAVPDGMPCDHVNDVLEQSEEKIVWRRSVNIHKPFWDQAEIDAKYYDVLKNAWIEGMLEESGITLSCEDEVYTMERKQS